MTEEKEYTCDCYDFKKKGGCDCSVDDDYNGWLKEYRIKKWNEYLKTGPIVITSDEYQKQQEEFNNKNKDTLLPSLGSYVKPPKFCLKCDKVFKRDGWFQRHNKKSHEV